MTDVSAQSHSLGSRFGGMPNNGRGERIRTSGPCLPKTVLYQAELLPDRNPRGDSVAAGAKAAAR
jgi:hypothetical protein